MESLEPLEEAVLTKLLVGELPVLVELRAQLPFLSVAKRTLTGVGFFTEFTVSPGAIPVPLPKGAGPLGDVEADIERLEHGAGFLLFVKKGFLHTLEGYSMDEPWPERIEGFSLRYERPDRRRIFSTLPAGWS